MMSAFISQQCACTTKKSKCLCFTKFYQFIVISWTIGNNGFMLSSVSGNPDAKLLYDELLVDYNRLIRPVPNASETVVVNLSIRLSQLIHVNMRMSMMVTNIWVEQSWIDYKLQWDPQEFGGVEELYVPSEHLWLPDIVLYNNWDGNYEVTLMTKATVRYTGEIEWKPPAIYKSSCEINVEWFPFDQQSCAMKFGSWTYDGFQVDLRHADQKNGSNFVKVGVDLRAFYPSVEWDIVDAPARRNEEYYPCCSEPYTDITFNLTMRRKTLFYTVNLIVPCVGISFLTVLVFYLPSASGEKIALCMSILLSLTVFLLLLGEIIPPTSLAVPLLGKSPSTHRMPQWVRTIFIETMPRYLGIQRPEYHNPQYAYVGASGCDYPSYYMDQDESNFEQHGFHDQFYDDESPVTESSVDQSRHGQHHGHRKSFSDKPEYPSRPQYSPEVLAAFESVEFIAQHIRNADKENEIIEDWKYVALVLDRIFLYIFLLIGLAGTLTIIILAPSLYDNRPPLHLPDIKYPVMPGKT